MHPTVTTGTAPAAFTPDWALAPGQILAEELKARGISQTDLAHRTSLSIKHVNQIIKRNAALSADVALAFERALGIPARFWLQTEAAWQAHNTAISARSSLGEFRSWLTQFPLPALAKKGVIALQDDTARQVECVLRFFQVTDPAAFEKVWLQPQVHYKRSQTNKLDPYATATWVRLAERAAQDLAVDAPAYTPKALRAATRDVRGFTKMPIVEGFRAARERLRQAGVMLVFVEPLDKTGLFGISMSLDDGRHMIGLTGRMKKLDSFWFALGHEIAHILLHPKRATFIDTITSLADDDDAQESEANKFASELFLPPTLRAELLALGPAAIEPIAAKAGVATAIVAGQYAHAARAYGAMNRYRPSIGENELHSLEASLSRGHLE